MSNEFNYGDPEQFGRVVDALIEIIGPDWLEPRIAALPPLSTGLPQTDGERLLRALSTYPAMVAALKSGQSPADPFAHLFLAMVGLVASQCARAPGGEQFARKLRDLARANQFSGFFDTLFEGEAALYWRDQMRAESIEFPDTSHPDFWATLRFEQVDPRIANECKRISPGDPKELAREALSARLEKELREVWSTDGALKVVVWLHVPTEEIDENELLGELRRVVADSHGVPGAWFTGGEPKGSFQISVALAPKEGEWAEREIRIDDVPAVGPLRMCVETRYLGKAQDPTRLKYVLSVRSDVLPNRIGAFEKNLVKAVGQLTQTTVAATGAINIRIRPPRALGDLFEADAIVRRVLRDMEADHVALTVLYWNEAERQEEPWQTVDDHTQREVLARYSLKTHFIAGSARHVDFRAIDSAEGRFPSHDGILMRDPETGSLAPVDKEILTFVEQQREEIDDNAATIYIALNEPFRQGLGRQVVRAVKAGTRVFLPMFDDALHFRVIEFEGWRPVRVATLDMRAWEGECELLFHLRWTTDHWTVAVSGPRARGEILATAVPLRQTFI